MFLPTFDNSEHYASCCAQLRSALYWLFGFSENKPIVTKRITVIAGKKTRKRATYLKQQVSNFSAAGPAASFQIRTLANTARSKKWKLPRQSTNHKSSPLPEPTDPAVFLQTALPQPNARCPSVSVTCPSRAGPRLGATPWGALCPHSSRAASCNRKWPL